MIKLHEMQSNSGRTICEWFRKVITEVFFFLNMDTKSKLFDVAIHYINMQQILLCIALVIETHADMDKGMFWVLLP